MTDDITKLKGERKTMRQFVSKIINVLDSEIKNDQCDKNIIDESLYLLNSKQVELKAINKNILRCLKREESEIEKECNAAI